MESAKALPMGSNWFSIGLLTLVNEQWIVNFAADIHQKISAKNLYCTGGGWCWVGGGWKDSSIFF